MATMVCEPAVRPLVAHDAVRLLPLPDRAAAEQPAMDAAPSVKLTEAVGLVPVAGAVKTPFAPTVEGLGALTSAVVVDAPPAVVTLTVSAVALTEVTITLTPYVLSVNACPLISAASPKPPPEPGVIATISVSSEPAVHSNGLATRICAPLLGQEKLAAGLLGLSKPSGCRKSNQDEREDETVGILGGTME